MKRAAETGEVPFAPRARLLKIIGEELISDEVVALTELVKNAHDADASVVSIEFRGDVASGDGEILICDDGHGMSLDVLLNNWMQPAGSTKRGAHARRSAQGRRMLGEKGVGRFAADKLGAQLELHSRVDGSSSEITAHFDWNQYADAEASLSDIRVRYEQRRAMVLDGPGTQLRITGLRTRWTERNFRRLVTRLGRLQSPFLGDHSFEIIIDSDDFPEYTSETITDWLEEAPHQLQADFDGAQTLIIRAHGTGRGRKIVWPGSGTLSCGPVKISLRGFDLETDALARIGPIADVRSWLKQWTGISVYRDGFRIWPYGEPHDDWLRLDQRRVNNPVVRLSNNQVVGFVEISGDANPELEDKTNREGLQHNQAFDDLRRLVLFALERLEDQRQQHRRPRGSTRGKSATAPEVSTTEAFDALKSMAGGLQSGRRVARSLIADAQKHVAQFTQSSTELIEELVIPASAGLANAAIGSSLDALIDNFRTRCAGAREWAQGDPALRQELTEALDEITIIKDQLHLLSFPRAKPRRRTIDLAEELDVMVSMHAPALEKLNPRACIHHSPTRRQAIPLRADVLHEDLRRALQHVMLNAMEAIK